MAELFAAETARDIVDLATSVAGANPLFQGNETERLYRNVRTGGLHPPGNNTAYEVICKTYLEVSAGPATAELSPAAAAAE